MRNLKPPTWFFNAAWIVLSTLAIPLAIAATFAILKLVTDQIGGAIIVDGQRRITEDYLFGFIFVPLFCLLTSFFQYILLRRRITRATWWILANVLGWGLAALGSQSPVKYGSILVQLLFVGLSPAIITGFAWWFLFRQSTPEKLAIVV